MACTFLTQCQTHARVCRQDMDTRLYIPVKQYHYMCLARVKTRCNSTKFNTWLVREQETTSCGLSTVVSFILETIRKRSSKAWNTDNKQKGINWQTIQRNSIRWKQSKNLCKWNTKINISLINKYQDKNWCAKRYKTNNLHYIFHQQYGAIKQHQNPKPQTWIAPTA